MTKNYSRKALYKNSLLIYSQCCLVVQMYTQDVYDFLQWVIILQLDKSL